MASNQLKFDLFTKPTGKWSPTVAAAIDSLASKGGIEARGAVFTRREVADFILDLAGYTADRPLHKMQILEPSFGSGDFLLPLMKRLLASWRSWKKKSHIVDDLGNAVCAVELHHKTFIETRKRVIEKFRAEGVDSQSAAELTDRWLVQGDFLLTPLEGRFDFVVGNPPYVRQELIPATLLAEYRSRYLTMHDRADLYIPFIERSLRLLEKGGNLGFICADRWTKNRYGGPLRSFIAENFHLKIYVDMAGTPAFHRDVSAYPAIIVIGNEKPGVTRIAHRPEIDSATLSELASQLTSRKTKEKNSYIGELACVTKGKEPWLLDSPDQLALLRRLEAQFPLLEEAGCKVGIGVATGADKAFIGAYDKLDVETDRKLPLATTGDILSGEVSWQGQGIINPFMDDGSLADLNNYPRLHSYLEARKDLIAGRHCARKNPSKWYRTIDRIDPALTSKAKLLIPDIKGRAHIVYEGGKLYPHHNLYFITSEEWDLRALQALLLSDVARFFIAAYSTKMRGGYLRFQAQYLRRIPIPNWNDVSETLRMQLHDAAVNRDMEACNSAAFELYGLNREERSILGGNGK